MTEFVIEFDEEKDWCPICNQTTDCGLNPIRSCGGNYKYRPNDCPLIKVVRLFSFEKEDTRWRIDQQ